MRSITPTPRGMALIMAMIVIVLITMLVAGAISFTGTERAAAEVQTQESSISACVQAARNLFLSRLQLNQGETQCPAGMGGGECLNINFNEILEVDELGQPKVVLRTGHVGELTSVSARRANALSNPMAGQIDGTSVTNTNQGTKFYIVTAVCRDSTATGDPDRAPEREIEFMVRVGI